uniref:Candidate secreted effector n=1 Tax=Meloidogyne incognita TaxID=6306 RepID=A0A914KZP1_MELIC
MRENRLHVGKRSSNLEFCCSHRHHNPVLANKHCVWRLKRRGAGEQSSTNQLRSCV